MGNFLSQLQNLFSWLSQDQHIRIVLLGLDAAGKTTALYRLKLAETVVTIPTIGFNVEEVQVPRTGITFTVWDIGGQAKLRRLWRHYFRDTRGLIYVVDSADRQRMEEASEELWAVLNEPEMAGVPFVVMANKQDQPMALNVADVMTRLRLPELGKKGHAWEIRGTCAVTGSGLFEAIEAMAKLSKQFVKKEGVYIN
ncbi:unnamed protein product [Protopolystoma xenopodis]|uniref:ADP-ribosylation factor n=1 Tax=Protopolystoma xenopodis TaxID=117903 RepID=A0A3S5ASA6_9PLAT|nr:unnamed protein product [Protopolystoma xenopodis]